MLFVILHRVLVIGSWVEQKIVYDKLSTICPFYKELLRKCVSTKGRMAYRHISRPINFKFYFCFEGLGFDFLDNVE